MWESLDSVLPPGVRPRLFPAELKRSQCTEVGGVP